MNWFGVISTGAYPYGTMTGVQRAAYAVSWGLLSELPENTAVDVFKGLLSCGLNMTMN